LGPKTIRVRGWKSKGTMKSAEAEWSDANEPKGGGTTTVADVC